MLPFPTFHCSSVSPTTSAGNVTVELHHPAALTCEWRCSGSLRWSRFQKSVAECDQTSCRSETGFSISHDQYLKGTPHLTITAAEYRNRGLYTCQCGGKDVCHLRLFIKRECLLFFSSSHECYISQSVWSKDISWKTVNTDRPSAFRSVC